LIEAAYLVVGRTDCMVLAGLVLPRQGLLVVLEGLGPVALLLIDPPHLVVGPADFMVPAGPFVARQGLLVVLEGLGPVALLS
jgi:hypothetical protein